MNRATHDWRSAFGRQWVPRLAAVMVPAMVLALVFLLAGATNNHLLYEQYYAPLFVLNAVVAGVLALVILWGVWRLAVRLRRGKFGSRLLVKLAAIFALVGVLPGVLIYVVSYQFVSRSIEAWFDVKVEGALASGLTLARTSLDTQARDFGHQLQMAAAELAGVPDALTAVPLEQIRQQLGASDVMLWSSSGRLIASAGQSRFELNPVRPSGQLQRHLRGQDMLTQLEGLDEVAVEGAGSSSVDAVSNARIRALVKARGASSIGLTGEQRLLEAVQPLSPTLVAHALAVQTANREYQERALGRIGLQRMYIGTLTLSLFLAVFGAVLLAVLLGKQLATPLLMLADGMRQVAAGDLRPKLELSGKDELEGLTRSFAQMTRQLFEARQAVDASIREVEAARAYLQTILDNLSSGVIVLDVQGVVVSANPSAYRILGAASPATQEQCRLGDLPGLQAFADQVQAEFSALHADSALSQHAHWQKQFELYSDAAGGVLRQTLSLLARGALLPGQQHLLVFDDISDVVSAQRMQAWGEVARRLAHEIKNPLTPIQLSAERLEHKLADKLEPADRALLAKSVHTIVEQVAAMQRLVNEFRDYARLPSADLKPLDLNALVSEVISLYGDNHQICVELDGRAPCILGDAQQLRQVIHNLVQNAQDATEQLSIETAHQAGAGVVEMAAGVPGHSQGRRVFVRTQWLEGIQRVRLSVTDQGPGFPDTILKRAFEPYVTTKAKGTGLGLAVVKKIADEHRARIDLSNCVTDGQISGAQVSLSFEIAV